MVNRLSGDKPSVWTIAGSDSGGGAGIQADLHTFQDFSVHGCSVITAVTAQNSVALHHSMTIDYESVSAQINALDSDLQADAIKLGMLADSRIMNIVADYLDQYTGFVVCDPVISSSTGGSLLTDEACTVLKERLIKRVDVITPNVFEAQMLTGLTINTAQDVVNASARLIDLGARSVLLTGGHWISENGQRLDYWTDGSQSCWLAGEDIKNINNHGSGCTLSAAIAAMIANGYEIFDALVVAKAYVTNAIREGVRVGKGPGAVAHKGWPSRLEDFPVLSANIPQYSNAFKDCGGQLGLYPVVDSVDWIAKLLPLGVPTIQLRMKEVSEVFAREQIARAIALCEAHNTRLFINDFWHLAIELGAYGVHLGQEDLDTANLTAIFEAGLRLGISTHSYYEIARAHGIRPSYIAIGPVYPTTTKVMKFSALGITQLKQWVDLLTPRYPLTAIGGINVERLDDVLSTGVGSCAMVTAITQANNYSEVVSQLIDKVDQETLCLG